MTQVSVGIRGLWYAPWTGSPNVLPLGTMDATAEKLAFIGYVIFEDGPSASSKTLSTGNIQYRTNAVTFANAGTTVDIGIQDVDATTSNPPRPDGTFDVKTTLTGGGGGITTTAWNTATMNSGSKSISHGQLIAVVFDMTARAGADSVIIGGGYSQTLWGANFGLTDQPFGLNNTGSWATTSYCLPNIVITFDDGTRAYLAKGIPFSSVNTEAAFSDSSNPDERGMIFQVPWDCKISALIGSVAYNNATTSDAVLTLYSTPLGTPASMGSFTLNAETENISTFNYSAIRLYPFTAEISLTKNTDYCIAYKATSTGTIQLPHITLGSANHRAALPFGTTMRKGTRNNSSGAFSEESPAVTVYGMGIQISSFDDGIGAGGLKVHPGMTGGLNG